MMTPVVWDYKKNEAVPVYTAFADLMTYLNSGDEKTNKYREELLGPGIVIAAPDEYWEMGLASQMGLAYTDYLEKPLHDRARFRAWSFLKNAVEVLERHKETMSRKRKELLAAAASKSKTPSRKRGRR